MSEGCSGSMGRYGSPTEFVSSPKEPPAGGRTRLSWSPKGGKGLSQKKKGKREGEGAPSRSIAQSKHQKHLNKRIMLKRFWQLAMLNFTSWNDWGMICSGDWFPRVPQGPMHDSGAEHPGASPEEADQLRPRVDFVRSHFMLWKSHKFPAKKVT